MSEIMVVVERVMCGGEGGGDWNEICEGWMDRRRRKRRWEEEEAREPGRESRKRRVRNDVKV